MIEGAEALACKFDFVRVDMYQHEGKPLFGEMTFYPGSGLGKFNPPSLDAEMGQHWLRARHLLGASRSFQCDGAAMAAVR